MYSLHSLYNSTKVTCSSALSGHPSSSLRGHTWSVLKQVLYFKLLLLSLASGDHPKCLEPGLASPKVPRLLWGCPMSHVPRAVNLWGDFFKFEGNFREKVGTCSYVGSFRTAFLGAKTTAAPKQPKVVRLKRWKRESGSLWVRVTLPVTAPYRSPLKPSPILCHVRSTDNLVVLYFFGFPINVLFCTSGIYLHHLCVCVRVYLISIIFTTGYGSEDECIVILLGVSVCLCVLDEWPDLISQRNGWKHVEPALQQSKC